MSDDIVDELRNASLYVVGSANHVLMVRGAEEIERLEATVTWADAEIARLRKDRDECVRVAHIEIEQLRARVADLGCLWERVERKAAVDGSNPGPGGR